MSIPRTEHADIRTLTDSIDKLRQRCATEGHELLRRATIPAQADGWPRRASGANPGTTTATRPHSDQSADPDDGYRIGHGDPTGNAATTPPATDPIAAAGRRFLRQLAHAEAALHRATTELDNSRPPRIDGVASDDQWCSNHLVHGMVEPRYRGDLCEWCYKFNLLERALPARSLIIIKHEKGRITQADITKAIGPRRKVS